jgi:hypothetical protein
MLSARIATEPVRRIDAPLVGQQSERRGDRHQGNGYSIFRALGGAVFGQAISGAPCNARGRGGDQRDLEQGGERLSLAVAEAMIVIGRRAGDADAVKRDQRGEQVEPESASDPSIATEPVAKAAKAFRSSRKSAVAALAMAAQTVSPR